MINSIENVSNNTTNIVSLYLEKLKVKVTSENVKKEVFRHPDFPSLNSISETLSGWNVENISLHLDKVDQINTLRLPIIAHLKNNGGKYIIIDKVNDENVFYTDDKKNKHSEDKNKFERNWSGNILYAEASEKSGEFNYYNNIKDENIDKFKKVILIITSLLITISIFYKIIHTFNNVEWIFFLLKTIGLFISTLLLIKGEGNKNKIADKICQATSSVNCNKVLNSEGAKLFKIVSWSEIGFVYFFTGTMSLIISNKPHEISHVNSWLSVASFPFIIYSVYYQANIVKQWCILCLLIQTVLFFEIIFSASYISQSYTSLGSYFLLLISLNLGIACVIMYKYVTTLFVKGKKHYTELMNFKRNSLIFNELLMGENKLVPERKVIFPIIIGNSTADNTIIMVTNPYCDPCAKMHERLKKLLQENKNIKIALVFYTCDGEDGKKSKVIRHLLALNDTDLQNEALDEWYKEKEYNKWSSKYPTLENNKNSYSELLDQHCKWCNDIGITSTPTLFVNGYKLPNFYQVEDLRWLINETNKQNKSLQLN